MDKVFIIDDDEHIASMLAEVVALSNFDAQIYNDARRFFEDEFYDDDSLILLDLNMPAMDGVEVIRQLAKNACRAKLILMSGYDSSVLHSAEKLAQAHELEIISSLNKPIQLKELLTILMRRQQKQKTEEVARENFVPTVFDVAHAIAHDQLRVFYQPQIDIVSNSLIGAEALVRWEHPEHGLIPPDAFLPLAEQGEQMANLTAVVLDKALRLAGHQLSLGHRFHLSVNVSSSTITSLELPEQLEELLRVNSLPPDLLTIEITESALMAELVTSLDILTRLRMKGINLSIDDFGTGFSSLSQLHKVPFNELKVDKSFVMHMDTDAEARAIVKTCIMLGHELKMKVVAEGIESNGTLSILQDFGCDIAQGYYISKPMPEVDFVKWLQDFDGL